MSESSSARVWARAASLLAPLCVAVACAPTARPNGESCIKDQDCLSGVCADLACAASPPLLDAQVTGPGSDASDAAFPPSDAGDGGDGAASADSGDAASGDDGGDGGTDGSADAPADGPGDGGAEGGKKDGGKDAKSD